MLLSTSPQGTREQKDEIMYTTHRARRSVAVTTLLAAIAVGAGAAGAAHAESTVPPAPVTTSAPADAVAEPSTTSTLPESSTTSTLPATSTTSPPAAIATTTVPSTTTAPSTTTPPSAIAQPVVAAATVATAPQSPVAKPGNGKVTLTWLAPSNNGGAPIDKYRVQRALSPSGPWTDVALPTTLSYTNTGLMNGTKYYFRIRAHNSAGWSPWSTVVSATPKTVPAAPYAPNTTPGNRNVVVTWLKPTIDGGAAIDKYAVQTAFGPNGPWFDLGFPTTTIYTAGWLTNGTTYYYRIRAHNAAGWGPWSTVVSGVPMTTPGAVPRCEASQLTAGSMYIRAEWDAPSTTGGVAIDSYRIEIWKYGSYYYTVTAANDPYLIWTFPVSSHGTYEVRISAVNAAGSGPYCLDYVGIWP
jgi:titin